MAEYINKAKLYEKAAEIEQFYLKRYCDTDPSSCYHNIYMYQLDEATEFKHMIADFPSEDFTPMRYGKWIKDHEYNITCVQSTNYHCSNCGRKSGYKQVKLYKYCPKCGAKMEL